LPYALLQARQTAARRPAARNFLHARLEQFDPLATFLSALRNEAVELRVDKMAQIERETGRDTMSAAPAPGTLYDNNGRPVTGAPTLNKRLGSGIGYADFGASDIAAFVVTAIMILGPLAAAGWSGPH